MLYLSKQLVLSADNFPTSLHLPGKTSSLKMEYIFSNLSLDI